MTVSLCGEHGCLVISLSTIREAFLKPRGQRVPLGKAVSRMALFSYGLATPHVHKMPAEACQARLVQRGAAPGHWQVPQCVLGHCFPLAVLGHRNLVFVPRETVGRV